MCPSISCSPIGLSTTSYVFIVSMLELPRPASTTSCMHLVSASKFSPPCARSKKTCMGSKKEGAKVQKTSSPMWAPITMEFPPTLWRQGPRSRRTGPKNRNRAPKQLYNLAVEKNPPGSSTNTCRSKKNIPTGSRKHTSKSPTFFVTLGPKKIRLGPKNMYRSKKRVPRSKKHASRREKTKRDGGILKRWWSQNCKIETNLENHYTKKL